MFWIFTDIIFQFLQTLFTKAFTERHQNITIIHYHYNFKNYFLL